MTKKIDYYEFLQISPNADRDTIHRVYRFLAARYHPDNPKSGDVEMFSTLTTAYEVLSNQARRAEYDAEREREAANAIPLSTTIDFMDNLEGETNRRLAVLAVLYFRRRTNPHKPEVSLFEIETRMGFPRDYLDFTTWYLQKKGFITRADNSDFTLTAQGVDFVETQRVHLPVLNKLLTNGDETEAENIGSAVENSKAAATQSPERAVVVSVNGAASRNGHSRTYSSMALLEERRLSAKDRRAGSTDRRKIPDERRRGI